MGQTNLVPRLRTRHAKFLGELEVLESRLEQARSEASRIPTFEAKIAKLRKVIGHLVPLIQHLDGSFDPSTTKPSRPFERLVPFKSGECARLALQTIRDAAEPMMVREVALVILAKVGIEAPKEAMILRTCNAIDATFRAYRGKTLGVMPDRRPRRWFAIYGKASQRVED